MKPKWLANIDFRKTRFQTSCPHCGESFDDDVNGYSAFRLGSTTGAKSVLYKLGNEIDPGYIYGKQILSLVQQMLEELETQ
jgi:hypothetical protein